MERLVGLEPTTCSLATNCATTALKPLENGANNRSCTDTLTLEGSHAAVKHHARFGRGTETRTQVFGFGDRRIGCYTIPLWRYRPDPHRLMSRVTGEWLDYFALGTIQINYQRSVAANLAGPLRFSLRLTAPEAVVLMLNDRPMEGSFGIEPKSGRPKRPVLPLNELPSY
jgi:hypothetical protein